MWYASGCNGGMYHHIKWEYPCEPSMDEMISSLIKQGKDFYVHYNQFEFDGYSGDVMLINDQTLETIVVHHWIAWGHSGRRYWTIEVREECENGRCDYYTVYDSRLDQPIVGLYILERWKKATSKVILCLPTESEVLFNQLDHLYMQMFNRHAKDLRDEYPYSHRDIYRGNIEMAKRLIANKESKESQVEASKTLCEDEDEVAF